MGDPQFSSWIPGQDLCLGDAPVKPLRCGVPPIDGVNCQSHTIYPLSLKIDGWTDRWTNNEPARPAGRQTDRQD